MLKNLLKGRLIKSMKEQNKSKETSSSFADTDKKETPHTSAASEIKEKTKVYNESERLTDKDFIKCLSQQTTSYERDSKFLVATGKAEELFLVNYFDNTFYIVKVAFTNGKLNVIYDYRRKSFLLEEFEYRIKGDEVTARLKLANSEVEFTVKPKITYQGECEIIRNQASQYEEFSYYLDTYRKNINSSAMERRNEKGYMELISAVTKISMADRKAIIALIEEKNKNEAIRKIQEKTGLGLADSAKIADKPYMYL